MRYYINVRGGLGFNFALARVISLLGTQHEFFIKSPYWDVFKACPYVKHVYKAEEARDFLNDARNNPGARLIQTHLYDMQEFVYKQYNYTQAWMKLLGIEDFKDTDNGTGLSILNLEPFKYFPNLRDTYDAVLKQMEGHKYLLVQFWGGQSPLDDYKNKPYSYENEPLKRAYPVEKAQAFVDAYKAAHPDVKIIQYSLPNEPKLEGTERYEIPYLVYYELAKNADCVGAVTVDSSLAHIVTGLTKVVTLWGHSLPAHFGYSINKNIIQSCNRADILYFTEMGPSGAYIDYIEPQDLFEKVNIYLHSAETGEAEAEAEAEAEVDEAEADETSEPEAEVEVDDTSLSE